MSEPGEADGPTVDARGLLCPLPVIRLQAAARGQPPGTLIRVLATDPGVLQDIPAWCRVHGHTLVAASEVGREIHITVRIGPSPHKRAFPNESAPK